MRAAAEVVEVVGAVEVIGAVDVVGARVVEVVGAVGRLGRAVVPSLVNRVRDSRKATICCLSPSLAEGSLAILSASLSLMT